MQCKKIVKESKPNLSPIQQTRLKLITGGDHAVGKSSLVRRFMGKGFSPDFGSTDGVDSYTKTFKQNSNFITMRIYDLAGQILYREVAQSYMEGADLVILVFDVTRKETFDNIEGWYETIFGVLEESKLGKRTPCALIGNKIDLKDQRVVKLEEGGELAKKLKCLYIETSAKENTNVIEAFNALILEFIKLSKEPSGEEAIKGLV